MRADWCAPPGAKAGEEVPFWIIDSSDWVNIVARAEGGEYIMVRQWRFGTRHVSLEIPGGIVDPGEEPARAAARELVEETGFVPAGPVRSLGTVDPNPAILSNRTHLFYAEGCRPATDAEKRAMDAHERIELRLVRPDELDGLIASGEISHSIMLAALLKYRSQQSTQPRP
ncbi:MAG TPA: NUDIX hydrolase [Planctomycetota bacterium]|nr:NUDIX hydrolase [Planctomycetota bacterium]